MSCDEFQTQLTALLDGELTPESAAAIEAHLAGCASCSAARDEMGAVLEMTRAWNVAGSAVLAAVQQQISQDEMHSVLLEMKRLRLEVVSLRAAVAELKIQVGQCNSVGKGNSDFLGFPYSAARDTVHLIL